MVNDSPTTSRDDGAAETWSPPENYRTVDLPQLPALSRSYRRALSRAATAVLPGTSSVRALPHVAVRSGPVVAQRGPLVEFQHLLGFPTDDVVPVPYVHVMTFPLVMEIMVRPHFPLPVLGMVHISSQFAQTRNITVDDELEITAWAEAPRSHRRGVTVDLIAVARDRDGRAIWRGQSTYLSQSGTATTGWSEALARPRTEVEFPDVPHQPSAVWTVLPTDIHSYAQLSGDKNPIHTSGLAARAFGFPGVIAHGMYTAARALAATGIRDALRWEVWFRKPVKVPSKVAFAQVSGLSAAPPGTVTETLLSDSAPAVTGHLIWNQDSGKTHLFGRVTSGPES